MTSLLTPGIKGLKWFDCLDQELRIIQIHQQGFDIEPNIVVESGIHPSLHPNCHYQIVCAKFNLKIYYPPPYLREVWHYKEANADLIKGAKE